MAGSGRWDGRMVALSVATVGAALFFWNAPLFLPIKLFVVLLHEISHGLAALLSGGSVERLVLMRDEGGLAFTRGGSRFLILSAGYLGSALWGAALMRLAWATPAVRRLAARALAALLAVALLLYARDPFTLFFTALAVGLFWLVAERGSAALQRALFWLLGTFSCLYALIDIGTDVLARGPLAGIPLLGTGGFSNDAELLASITLVPAFAWGLLWSALAVAIFALTTLSLARQRGHG